MAFINILKNHQISSDAITTEDLSHSIEPAKKNYFISNAFKANSLEVFLNGILLSRNNDYIENLNNLSFTLDVNLNLLNTMNKNNTSLIVKYIKI